MFNSSLYCYPIASQNKFYNCKTQLCQGRTQWCYVFLQTKLQQINVQEHMFGEFALAPLTFGPCTSPIDTFSFAYHFLYVYIPIINPLNCSPICALDNFQRFQFQNNIFDHSCWRRCYHFRFTYTLDPSGDFFCCG